jgi:hypothetical protein
LGAALQADGERRSVVTASIVDDTGRIMKEVKVASEPQALLKVLGTPPILLSYANVDKIMQNFA